MNQRSHKEQNQGEDAFLSAADKASDWFQDHRRLTLGGFGAVIVLVAVGLIWQQMQHRGQMRAAESFAQGFQALQGRIENPNEKAGLKTAQGKEQNPNGHAAQAEMDEAADAAMEEDVDRPVFADEKARWTAAKQAFEQAEDMQPNGKIGILGGLMAADLDEKLQDLTHAEKHFEGLQKKLSGDDRLQFLAVERFAYLREAQGDLEGAYKALEPLTDNKRSFFADHALLHQARIREAGGEKQQAIALLESIMTRFPRTALSEEVSTRLALLGAGQGMDPNAVAQEDGQQIP